MSEQENTPIPDENSNPKNEIIPIISEFLKDTNINEVISTYFKGKKEEIEANKIAHKNNLEYWKFKFGKEFFVILLILISICLLSYLDKIDNCTLGTLFGSIIGYTIGNFNSNRNNKS